MLGNYTFVTHAYMKLEQILLLICNSMGIIKVSL